MTKKDKYIRAAAVFLAAAGVFLVITPKIKEIYYQQRQEALLEGWKTEMSILGEEPTEDSGGKAEQLSDHVTALLRIDKIDLEIPVIKETTSENLMLGVTTMEGSAKPGETGNLTLAGHRFHTRGRGFNRLDELETDDLIRVETKEQEYTYQITEKLYIMPEDTWILDAEGTKKEITLVTCHYVEDKTLRLAVKGMLAE